VIFIHTLIGTIAGFLLYLIVVIPNLDLIVKNNLIEIVAILFGCVLVYAGSYIGDKLAN